MSTQTTLHDYGQEYEWTTEEFTKTVIFDLKRPTERKRDRLDAAIESAAEVQAVAARRLPSVPRHRWGAARPKRSVWYEWAKTVDSHLSNHTVHENIQRVREAFESWRGNGFRGDRPAVERFAGGNRCAFYYGQPTYAIHDGTYYVSLPLAAGRGERELLPLRDSDYLREYADRIRDGDLQKGRMELHRPGGDDDRAGGDRIYRIHQAVRTDVDVIADPITTVGVDVGLTNLAVAGALVDGEKMGAELWSGAEVAEMRHRFADRKRQAQSEQQYELLRDEESRFVEHQCHVISREIVEWALEYDRPEIVLEDLTDIRETFIRREKEHQPGERRALHSWPFDKLQTMVEYKALEAGVPTRHIGPRNTSKECNECGHVAVENRDGVYFACVSCGYRVNADVNAAFTIASI